MAAGSVRRNREPPSTAIHDEAEQPRWPSERRDDAYDRLVPRPSSLGSPSPGSASLSHIASRINQALQAADLSQDATTTLSKRSVSVQVLADKAYFANDSATLGATGDRVVDTIAGVVRTLSNDVRVEGFTDNTPIVGGPFISNWELSAVRAVNVVQRLQTHDGIAGGRLSAIGYGTTRPVVPNTTPANRAENRRIDVVILTATQAFPAGGAGTSPPVPRPPSPRP